MHRTITACLLTSLTLVAGEEPTTDPERPWPRPVAGFVAPAPGEHPRLFLRRADLERVRARARSDQGRALLDRLRELLGGDKHLTPVVNTFSTVNTGAKGPGQLPIGAFTVFHPVGFATLYLATGEARYADLARASVERLRAGVPDRDERYGFVRCGGGLRVGMAFMAIAIAYDLCYDAWEPAYREEIATLLLTHGTEVNVSEGGGKQVTLRDLAFSPRLHPHSNHWGKQVGPALVTALALRGDPGVDGEAVDAIIAKAKEQVLRSFDYGHGTNGHFNEGHHCGRMTHHGIMPAILALRSAAGEDWATGNGNVEWATTRWIYEIVRQDGRLACWMRDRYARDTYTRDMIHGGEFALGFGLMPAAHRAPVKWFYEQVVRAGKEADYDLVVYPHHALFALLSWPFELAPVDPDEALPHHWWDRKSGYVLLRNRWQDGNDIVVSTHTGSRWGFGGTGQGGEVRFLGLGLKGRFPGGFYRSSLSHLHAAKDGSGTISAIRINTHLAVDMSGRSGAALLLTMRGRGSGGHTWKGFGNHKAGTVSSRVTVLGSGADEWWVLTLADGDHPRPELISATEIRVGNQTVSFNGRHLVLADMAALERRFDPEGDYWRPDLSTLSTSKLFPDPADIPEPTLEEVLGGQLQQARKLLARGKDNSNRKAMEILDGIVFHHPDHPLATEARELLAPLRRAADDDAMLEELGFE